MEGGGGGVAVFPVAFYDGEREINIGNVRIHPSLDYKTFQSILSQKIGISANQITIYLVEGKRSKFSPEIHRKILITGKANFSVIAREANKECFFLVVLKRSRRDRRRNKPKQSSVELGEYLPESAFLRPQWPENILLLRRNQNQNETDLINSKLSDYASPYYNQFAQAELANYNERVHNLLLSRENYVKDVSNKQSDLKVQLGLDYFPRIEESYKSYNRRLCKDCNNKDSPAEFHLCVDDQITVGFRSPVGPIAPPYNAAS